MLDRLGHSSASFSRYTYTVSRFSNDLPGSCEGEPFVASCKVKSSKYLLNKGSDTSFCDLSEFLMNFKCPYAGSQCHVFAQSSSQLIACVNHRN